MKKSIHWLVSACLLLTACTSHQKKILIYANSNIEVDASQKNISVQEGTTQVEKELIFSSSDPVILNVKGPQGNFSLEAGEDGYFIANLKPDTLIGSQQHTGETIRSRITQDQLKIQLDSLNKLVKGNTIAGKNYFILPGHIEKITSIMNAKIFGPFHPVPAGFDAGSVPEIYKFYKISEIKDIIDKLTEMSIYKYEKDEKK